MMELGWHDHSDLGQLEPSHHLTNMFSNHKSNILARSKKKKKKINHKLYVDRCYVDIESESALSSRSPEVTCSNGWSCTHCSAVCFI